MAEAPQEERRRDYEMSLVLSSRATDEERDAVIEKVRFLLNDSGSEVIEVSLPKDLVLAYPINKERQGIFRMLVFRGRADVPRMLTEALRHEHTVLRQLIVDHIKKAPAASFSNEKRGSDDESPPAERSAENEAAMDAQIEEAVKDI